GRRFGAAAAAERVRAVVHHARARCGAPGWPAGEASGRRADLVERAFPEDEWVVVEQGRGQKLVYERRLGKRLQLEGEARTAFDSLHRAFDGVTAAIKYNLWHSLEHRALATLGLEVTPPLGRQDLWEVEPYVAFGAVPVGALVVQGQIVSTWEESGGATAVSYRLGAGRQIGRLTPMLEAGWTVPTKIGRAA